MRFFKNKRYRNYRLVPIPAFKGMKIPWEKYERLYEIDEWIRAEDINFKGETHGFGPCPPDQYSLHFAHDRIKKLGEEPFFLFL